MNPLPARRHRALLVAILACYACARLLQVIYGPTPTTPLVALDVLSAMAFALADGARRYGVRGILVFAGISAVIGNIVENVGVATGFPFGHYVFLDVMGPRIFAVPVLLGFAYIGMAYVSFTLAGAVVGPVTMHHPHLRIVTVPCVASFFMLAWDLAQDPVWSTMLRAWEWHDGGPWFGVPLSNYCGWFATVFLICLLFASYLRRARPAAAQATSNLPALIFYALCAAGNVLQVLVRRTASQVPDGSGKLWRVDDILHASALVSLFVMGAFAVIAGIRLVEAREPTA